MTPSIFSKEVRGKGGEKSSIFLLNEYEEEEENEGAVHFQSGKENREKRKAGQHIPLDDCR